MGELPYIKFYLDDWLGGTLRFDRRHKGAYLDLLIMQAKEGHFTENDVKHMLSADFDCWERLKCKFLVDSEGRFYNRKMQDVVEQMVAYIESRKSNGAHEKHMRKHMQMDMGVHTGSGYGSGIGSGSGEEESEGKRAPKRFTPPTVTEVADYCHEKGYGIDAQTFVDHYTANGWKVGKNPMKDWQAAVRNWEARSKSEHGPVNTYGRQNVTPKDLAEQARRFAERNTDDA